MITIHINDQAVSAEPETTVLQAARSHGIPIPTLCHHPALKPSGSCKVCAVAVEKVLGGQDDHAQLPPEGQAGNEAVDRG